MSGLTNFMLCLTLLIVEAADITISDTEFLATITSNTENGRVSASTPSSSISQPTPTPMSLVKSSSNRTSVSETHIVVQIGTHAYLPCNVQRLHGKPVSWVRVRDGHILTVDQTTFIADQRFQSIYADEQERWSLQIKYVQEHDMGLYECQVSTEPKMSARVYLKVVVPKTELIGDHNRFVKAGSKVALHCIVRGSIDPPSYILWFKGNSQIADENSRGWYMEIDNEIFGNSSDRQNTIGSLIIPSVSKSDSGNYTCSPSNSAPVTVDLHVLSGEYSASAIMSSASVNCINCLYLGLLMALLKHIT